MSNGSFRKAIFILVALTLVILLLPQMAIADSPVDSACPPGQSWADIGTDRSRAQSTDVEDVETVGAPLGSIPYGTFDWRNKDGID